MYGYLLLPYIYDTFIYAYYLYYIMQQTKITKKIIEQTVKEHVPKAVQVFKQSGTNDWFIRFARFEDITEDVYETLKVLSFVKIIPAKKPYVTIIAELNLKEVNTYYERQLHGGRKQ